MLVLSRKHGEEILIGDDVVITVVEVHGKYVHLGIDAPKQVPVRRREVHEAIRRDRNNLTPPTDGDTLI